LTDAYYSTSVNGPSQVYHFSRRQCDWHLDAANQGASNGHILYRTPSNPLLPARDYLPDHHVCRNYFHLITFT